VTLKTPPICRFPAPKPADLPQDIRERIEAVKEKSGSFPMSFLRSPDARTSFAPSSPIMTL
jgi:hypothetical protein